MIVVVPCYNEAERLDADEFRRFAAVRDDVEFLLVNDGSSDATLPLLESLRDADPLRFSVCHLAENRGKAEAVRRGFLEAFRSRPDYVAFWDADLATPLEAIPTFARVLDDRPDVEIVVGTRIPLLGRKIQRAPRRRLLGRVFSAVASRMLGLAIYDTQCGAKMFRVSPEIEALFARPFSTRWIFDVEILARLIRNRRLSGDGPAEEVLYEMPLAEWLEKGGSKLKSRDFAKAVVELAVIWRKNLFGLPRRAEPGQPADVVPLAPSRQPSEIPSSRDAA
jgi:glycosyltransferase involved in cell wall biosynthesis